MLKFPDEDTNRSELMIPITNPQVRVPLPASNSWSLIRELHGNIVVLEIDYSVIEISINYAKCCNIYIIT